MRGCPGPLVAAAVGHASPVGKGRFETHAVARLLPYLERREDAGSISMERHVAALMERLSLRVVCGPRLDDAISCRLDGRQYGRIVTLAHGLSAPGTAVRSPSSCVPVRSGRS
jgi:hypothetical protein